MSIEKVSRKRKAHVWRVRWRDDTGRKQSKTFDRKSDAEAFEAKVKLAKRRGDLEDLSAGKQRLDAFVKEWTLLYAEPQLATKTRAMYDDLLGRYILPRLGKHELRRLKPQLIQRFSSELASEGVGQETVRKSLALLQGILQRAVEWGRVRVNPVKAVKKPPSGRKRAVRPLAPAAVEKIRRKMHPRDATLVSVLAYAGLRPGEALALTWVTCRAKRSSWTRPCRPAS